MIQRPDAIHLKREYQEIVDQFKPGNNTYIQFKELCDSHGKPATFTSFWYWSNPRLARGDGDMFVKTDPPIAEAPLSRRVLITASRYEASQLAPYLERVLGTYSMHQRRLPDQALGNPMAPSSLRDLEITYAVQAESFWEQFFAVEDFLGESAPITIPCGIISNGNIRAYLMGAGATISVGPRLEQIAQDWGIPYVHMEIISGGELSPSRITTLSNT